MERKTIWTRKRKSGQKRTYLKMKFCSLFFVSFFLNRGAKVNSIAGQFQVWPNVTWTGSWTQRPLALTSALLTHAQQTASKGRPNQNPKQGGWTRKEKKRVRVWVRVLRKKKEKKKTHTHTTISLEVCALSDLPTLQSGLSPLLCAEVIRALSPGFKWPTVARSAVF